ncbi:MAG: hypothetical protein ACYSW3_30140 [Planctomycetota bacterium]|jgi:hypothetical protein
MYDDSRYGMDQLAVVEPATWANDANGIIGQMKFFRKVKVKECSAVITGEVFNDGTIVVKLDDTSIGDIIVTTKFKYEFSGLRVFGRHSDGAMFNSGAISGAI